jgi:hypothetical protein
MEEMEKLKERVREILESEGLEEDLVDKLADKIYNNLIISKSFNGAKIEGNLIINNQPPEEYKAEVFANDLVNFLRRTKKEMQTFTLLGFLLIISAVVLISLGGSVINDGLKWLPFVLIPAGLFSLSIGEGISKRRHSIYLEYSNRIYELAPHRKDLLAKLRKVL